MSTVAVESVDINFCFICRYEYEEYQRVMPYHSHIKAQRKRALERRPAGAAPPAKRKWKPGTKALAEIRYYQKAPQMIMAKRPFHK